MKSFGASSPRSTCFKRCSHSAVSSGDCRDSGSTVMSAVPVAVGIRDAILRDFLRSAKPEETSFSRIPARVAGVPMPLRSASSGISFAPAFSMLDRSVSSV